MKPPRIIFVRGARGITDITGAESYLFSLMHGLKSLGCESKLVFITSHEDSYLPFLDTVKSKNILYETILVKNKTDTTDLFRLPQIVKEFAADIVHPIDHRADVISFISSLSHRTPIVATFTGWTNWNSALHKGKLYSWLDRQSLIHADAVLVDSDFHGATLKFNEKSAPIVIIPNGVDKFKFDPAKIDGKYKEKVFADKDIFLFGMIGRIHPNKGQIDVVRAAVKIIAEYPSSRFLIVGDATEGYEYYKQEVSQLIKESGVTDKIILTNFSHDEIPSVLASFDILVAPSFIEGCSYTILEAMAMNKAIIASNAGGTPETIADGKHGLLVSPGEPEQIIAAAKQLLDDTSQRTQLANSARKRFEEKFTIEVMANNVLQVYQQVISWRSQQHISASRNLLKKRLLDSGFILK